MPGPKRAALARAQRYCTDSQSLVLAHWVFDFWDQAGFAGMYDGEARRFMPRLLLAVCMAELKGQPFTMSDAFIAMDAKHGRTLAKYVDLAIASGFITRVSDPSGDKRKTHLRPTVELLTRFHLEMERIAGEVVEVLAALGEGDQKLPETHAAKLAVERRNDEFNRHLARLGADDRFPSRKPNFGFGFGKFIRVRGRS
jgi:hypothetical protein